MAIYLTFFLISREAGKPSPFSLPLLQNGRPSTSLHDRLGQLCQHKMCKLFGVWEMIIVCFLSGVSPKSIMKTVLMQTTGMELVGKWAEAEEHTSSSSEVGVFRFVFGAKFSDMRKITDAGFPLEWHDNIILISWCTLLSIWITRKLSSVPVISEITNHVSFCRAIFERKYYNLVCIYNYTLQYVRWPLY